MKNTHECNKCKKRFKLLTDENLCFFCDKEGWINKYYTKDRHIR